MPLPKGYEESAATTATVEGPSGWAYLWRPADLAYLVKRGLLPDDLRRAAMESERVTRRVLGDAAKGVDVEADDEAMSTLDAVTSRVGTIGIDAQVAGSIIAMRSPEPGAAFGQVLLTANDVDELHPADKEALRSIITGHDTPRGITALVLADRGEIPEAEAIAIWTEEQERLPRTWATFRGIARRAGTGPDRGGVANDTEQPAGLAGAADRIPAE
jgi:hypothetical protein